MSPALTRRLKSSYMSPVSPEINLTCCAIVYKMQPTGSIHSDRLKGRYDYGREKNPEFYYKITKIFSKEQNIFLYTLHLNNKPIAYLYCIKMGNILYGLKTTYDSAYYAFSPGVVLFYKSIEHMYNQKNIEKFEIGRGEERFKKEWPTLSDKQSISYLGNRRLTNTIYFIFKFDQ